MLLRERGGRIKSEWTLRCPVTNTMPYPAIRARCNREIPRVQIEDLCEGCISLSNAEGFKNGQSTRRTSFWLRRFLPWLTVIKRSSVSLRIMVLRPTFKTGSLPQSTNFRMVFLPIPVHSAASSMVSPILTALILSTSFLEYSFCNYCFIIILILPSLVNLFCNHS